MILSTPPNLPALLTLISKLTHTVDGLERFDSTSDTISHTLGFLIGELHETIDGLNALYDQQLNEVSEERRAKWLLRDVIRNLPVRRDWLDPDIERAARAMLGMSPMEVVPSGA